MTWNPRDQRIVITGASDGIGAELARRLAAQGSHLVLAARGRERLEVVAGQCRTAGAASVLALPTDVSVVTECEALITRARTELGGIDVLLNNAGVSTHAPLEDAVDGELFERLLQVNLMGSVWCTRHALPALRASKGQLVAVCSLAGRLGLSRRSAYCASKFAQDGFFQALRSELDETGVTVTVAYPGFVASGFAEHSLDAAGNPGGVAAVNPSSAMSVETCAELILEAMADRRPEVVMTPRGRFALWLKLLSPTLVDRMSRSTVAAAKRKAAS